MFVSRGHAFGVFLGAVTLLGPVSLARADIYIYRLPNGTQMITDRPMTNKHYRLVRRNRSVEGLGAALARGRAPWFRDPAVYDRVIVRTATRYGVDPSLIKAVIHAESAFDPHAVSRRGASGLMQLMPATARQYGVRDVFDAAQNIRGGARYLRDLLRRFGGDRRLALAAYNAGEQAVLRHRGIPPYPETRRYVYKVLGFHQRYARVEFTKAAVASQ